MTTFFGVNDIGYFILIRHLIVTTEIVLDHGQVFFPFQYVYDHYVISSLEFHTLPARITVHPHLDVYVPKSLFTMFEATGPEKPR